MVWGFHSVKMDLCETVRGKLVWFNGGDEDDADDDDDDDDAIWAVANVAAILLTEAAITCEACGVGLVKKKKKKKGFKTWLLVGLSRNIQVIHPKKEVKKLSPRNSRTSLSM